MLRSTVLRLGPMITAPRSRGSCGCVGSGLRRRAPGGDPSLTAMWQAAQARLPGAQLSLTGWEVCCASARCALMGTRAPHNPRLLVRNIGVVLGAVHVSACVEAKVAVSRMIARAAAGADGACGWRLRWCCDCRLVFKMFSRPFFSRCFVIVIVDVFVVCVRRQPSACGAAEIQMGERDVAMCVDCLVVLSSFFFSAVIIARAPPLVFVVCWCVCVCRC